METLGLRLKKIRTEKNLTQTALGEILGVTKQAVANVESSHSNPSIEFMNKLIKNLNVNANWLIAGTGSMFNNIAELKKDCSFAAKVKELLKQEGFM